MSGEVEFDHIAPVYDETRRPPTEEEVRALAGLLENCRTVLDAGVGTGRFAVPLHTHGFEIVGADLSKEMMRRARAKGITTLVRADLRHLPFRDKIVDAAFMAHVLQLIPDPRPLLAELGRVARTAVVILLPEWQEREQSGAWREVRTRFREIAAELGYTLPERGTRYRHSLDDLKAIATPVAVLELTGPPPLVGTAEDRFAQWEARASGESRIPPEVTAEIFRRLRAERRIDPSTWSRPRKERFVAWNPTHLASTTAG